MTNTKINCRFPIQLEIKQHNDFTNGTCTSFILLENPCNTLILMRNKFSSLNISICHAYGKTINFRRIAHNSFIFCKRDISDLLQPSRVQIQTDEICKFLDYSLMSGDVGTKPGGDNLVRLCKLMQVLSKKKTTKWPNRKTNWFKINPFNRVASSAFKNPNLISTISKANTRVVWTKDLRCRNWIYNVHIRRTVDLIKRWRLY